MKNSLKINLGSGGRPKTGFMNVDKSPLSPSVDLVYDLNLYPWPFESDSADEIEADHVLEHLNDRDAAMREMHRILKPAARAVIRVPHFTSQLAFQDPTHRFFFARNTFFYYAGRGGYYDFKFSGCEVRIIFGKRISFWNFALEPLANLFPNIYEQSPLRVFPALEIRASLTK